MNSPTKEPQNFRVPGVCQASRQIAARRWLVLAASLLLGLLWSSADAAEVRVGLSRDATTVGEPVRFDLHVQGGHPAELPRNIRVDGLDISFMGKTGDSYRMDSSRGLSSEAVYSYRVTPARGGAFTIPAMVVEVNGQVLRTEPIGLRVENDPGAAGGGANAPLGKIGVLEIILPKKTAYVGEAVPVEVRLLVDSRIRWQLETMPDLQGEGFTKTKMPEPRQERGRRDGREYDVTVFQTTLTPSKAGKIMVGPSEIAFAARIPRARPNRQRSPFDDFFGNDFFNDPFFGGFGATERRIAKADPVELEVKPVPSTGKPSSFSGAVGAFTLSGDGNPKSVKIGDPLTMTVNVTGKGNFDRVSAPVLSDANGWRAYPPSNSFRAEDDVGLRGTKTFQIAVIPEVKKTVMPRFEFSYFDPEAEKYVTLTTEPEPLTVEGAPPPAPSAPAAGGGTVSSPPDSPEKAGDSSEPAPLTDILGLRYDAGSRRSFTPIYQDRAFWLVQLVPLAVLAGLGISRLVRSSAAAREAAGLRRDRAAQLARLQKEQDRAEFLDAAARTIQIDTALLTGQIPGAVDATVACRSRSLEPATEEAIREIFERRAELLYAGNGQIRDRLSETERSRVLATVDQFEKSHGRN